MIGFVHGRVSALLDDLTDPLMLEFAAGIVIAAQFNRLRALPIWLSAISLLVGAAIVAMTVNPATDGATTRVLILGPAALLILAGSIGSENALQATPIRSLLLLGDASYSLYLTHPISISAAALMWERLHLPTGSSPLSVLFVPIAIASSIIGAIAFYRAVELPILKWAMSRLHRDGRTRTN